jgi:hypothetical protein
VWHWAQFEAKTLAPTAFAALCVGLSPDVPLEVTAPPVLDEVAPVDIPPHPIAARAQMQSETAAM